MPKINLKELVRSVVVLQEGADDKIRRLEKTGTLTEFEKALIRTHESKLSDYWSGIKSVDDIRQVLSKLSDDYIYSSPDAQKTTAERWNRLMEEDGIPDALRFMVVNGIVTKYKKFKSKTPKPYNNGVFLKVVKEHGFTSYKKFESHYNDELVSTTEDYINEHTVYVDELGGTWIEFYGESTYNNSEEFISDRTIMNTLSPPNWCLGQSLSFCTDKTHAENSYYFRIDPDTNLASVSLRMDGQDIVEESGTVGGSQQTVEDGLRDVTDTFIDLHVLGVPEDELEGYDELEGDEYGLEGDEYENEWH